MSICQLNLKKNSHFALVDNLTTDTSEHIGPPERIPCKALYKCSVLPLPLVICMSHSHTKRHANVYYSYAYYLFTSSCCCTTNEWEPG